MSTELQQVLSSLTELKTDITELKTDVNGLKADVSGLKTDMENSNTKFDNYQKATQWVVNLAFSLIASATVITVVSSVFRR
jgi:predicted  nucleic acid-binding Zn-ribbon protein